VLSKNLADNARNDRKFRVLFAFLQTGEAFFGGTTWRGQRCMRISVCNWQTNEQDVVRTIAAVEQALSKARKLE
jgi:aromatic-L-amino-acid decarboxylase